ncbi:MAG: glycosyltransferase family 2 protein [Oscillospiraceae bacterium]|nr:glycosyltransferase family 2 protein [Oscillospiraceae bacterium]
MTNYLVTASIVTFNNISTIESTLRTLKEQTQGVRLHLYVIDNSSHDGTLDFVADLDPNIELVRIPWNVGFGAGHNLILPRLRSKYHVIINPDISLSEDAITNMARYMDENPDVAMLSPRIVYPKTGEPQILGKRNPRLKYLFASRLRRGKLAHRLLHEYAMTNEMNFGKTFDIENATGCFMFIRTETLQKIGGFDERYFLYFEDCDITRSLAKQGRVLWYPHATVQHAWKRESKKNFRLMLIQIESMLRYFWKWRFGGKKT